MMEINFVCKLSFEKSFPVVVFQVHSLLFVS